MNIETMEKLPDNISLMPDAMGEPGTAASE
jgi:hypothetical protein